MTHRLSDDLNILGEFSQLNGADEPLNRPLRIPRTDYFDFSQLSLDDIDGASDGLELEDARIEQLPVIDELIADPDYMIQAIEAGYDGSNARAIAAAYLPEHVGLLMQRQLEIEGRKTLTALDLRAAAQLCGFADDEAADWPDIRLILDGRDSYINTLELARKEHVSIARAQQKQYQALRDFAAMSRAERDAHFARMWQGITARIKASQSKPADD